MRDTSSRSTLDPAILATRSARPTTRSSSPFCSIRSPVEHHLFAVSGNSRTPSRIRQRGYLRWRSSTSYQPSRRWVFRRTPHSADAYTTVNLVCGNRLANRVPQLGLRTSPPRVICKGSHGRPEDGSFSSRRSRYVGVQESACHGLKWPTCQA
jgi:hypothetical protein